MKKQQFLDIAKKIAIETPTKYKLGGVGQHEGKYFLFDCIGLPKSILWGFDFDYNQYRGGAIYESNGVPDYGANKFFEECCYDKSTNMSLTEPGELVWMDGHIGIYIGDLQVVEATAAWGNKVLISHMDYDGTRSSGGRVVYRWTHHGKCKFIDYSKTEKPKPSKKTIDELAQEVIDGKWGNNPERKEKLIAAGYDYNAVQDKLNEILGSKNKKSIDELAQEVIDGKWGNNPERKKRLTNAGYNYEAVQNRVNQILGK